MGYSPVYRYVVALISLHGLFSIICRRFPVSRSYECPSTSPLYYYTLLPLKAILPRHPLADPAIYIP